MAGSILKTFSLNSEVIKKLEEINYETRKSNSELIRTFINYFSDNLDKLEEILKGEAV